MNQIFLMGLIANRGLRKKYLAFFEEHHITVVLSTMAAGTASNTILDALGLEATEKTVYFAPCCSGLQPNLPQVHWR